MGETVPSIIAQAQPLSCQVADKKWVIWIVIEMVEVEASIKELSLITSNIKQV